MSAPFKWRFSWAVYADGFSDDRPPASHRYYPTKEKAQKAQTRLKAAHDAAQGTLVTSVRPQFKAKGKTRTSLVNDGAAVIA